MGGLRLSGSRDTVTTMMISNSIRVEFFGIKRLPTKFKYEFKIHYTNRKVTTKVKNNE